MGGCICPWQNRSSVEQLYNGIVTSPPSLRKSQDLADTQALLGLSYNFWSPFLGKLCCLWEQGVYLAP